MTDETTSIPNQPEQIGRYIVKEEIGRGGMATVYLAEDPQFKRDVALKVLPREFTHNPHFRERFQREAQAIAALEHNAIVPVYDFGEDDGRAFLVMRVMKGGSLAERIDKGPLPLEDCAKILDQIASALDVAHKRGIIHRDVKPGNVLFDEHRDAFISDFGLVKIGESASSLTGSMIVGTPAYMAPEMSQSGGLTSLVDVYALGVTLYQMVTGNLPYEADTPLGTMLAHAVEPIPDISTIVPNLPADVARVIRQGIAKQPANRYQAAKQLATDFRNAVEGRPLQYQIDRGSGATKQVPSEMLRERMSNTTVTPPASASPTQESTSAEPTVSIPVSTLLGGGALVVAVLLMILLFSRPGTGTNEEPPVAAENTVEATEEPTDEPTATETTAPTETTEPTQVDDTPTATARPSPEGAPIGGGGRFIAFHSDEPGNTEIYLYDFERQEQIRLTNEPGPDTSPVWSPDGERIAFVSRRMGNLDIFTMTPEGDDLQQLTNDSAGDFDPAWSPDGERIAFISGRDGNNELYVMNADGGDQRRLRESQFNDLSPAWSPDGERIAFTSLLDGTENIYIISAATGSITEQVTEGTRKNVDPAWSPDGSKLAYASNRDGDWDIYIYDFETQQETQLTLNNSYDGTPAWSPDGEWIIFALGRQYQVEQGIARIRADGTGLEELTVRLLAFFAEAPSWQPPRP